jgi:hypothetical protein
MKRLLQFLSIGWLLAAPAPALTPVSEEIQALCRSAQAVLHVDEATFSEGLMKAHGKWEVKGGASAVMLEYRVDMDRQQSEVRPGESGTWEAAQPWKKCGEVYTLRVYAFPVVAVGPRLVHCLEKGTSVPSRFTISCAPAAEIGDCRWDCKGADGDRHCSGICTASVKGGRPPYLPFWGVDKLDFQPAQPPAEGPWTHPVACAPGQRISFKVRDYHGTGVWSPVVEKECGVSP